MSDYITLNADEYAALTGVADPLTTASIQLSRRDSLDQPCAHGFLVVSVVPREGEQWRVAIGVGGSTVPWGKDSDRVLADHARAS